MSPIRSLHSGKRILSSAYYCDHTVVTMTRIKAKEGIIL
jgi:hypothetical protein